MAQKVKKVIDVGNDPSWSLNDWQIFIKKLIEDHGKDSILYTDAGYNNVSLMVEKSE